MLPAFMGSGWYAQGHNVLVVVVLERIRVRSGMVVVYGEVEVSENPKRLRCLPLGFQPALHREKAKWIRLVARCRFGQQIQRRVKVRKRVGILVRVFKTRAAIPGEARAGEGLMYSVETR